MTEDNLKRMHQEGNILGSHTVNHPLMSKLNLQEQKFQINNSFEYLESIGCLNEKTYCHPYGGFILLMEIQ